MNLSTCLKALILLLKAERLASEVRRVLLGLLLLMPLGMAILAAFSKQLDKKALKKKWRALLK